MCIHHQHSIQDPADYYTIAVVTITYSKVLLTESAEGFHVFWFCILTSTAAGKWQHTATGSSGFMRSPFYILQQNLIRTSGFRKCHHARLRRWVRWCLCGWHTTQDLKNDGNHAVQSLSSLLSPPLLLLHSGAFHSIFSCLLDAICVC